MVIQPMRQAIQDEASHDEVGDEEIMGFLALQWHDECALARVYKTEVNEQANVIREFRDLNQRMTSEGVRLLQEVHLMEENGQETSGIIQQALMVRNTALDEMGQTMKELASREERAKYLEDGVTMTKQELQEKAALVHRLQMGSTQHEGAYVDEVTKVRGAFNSQEASIKALRSECGELARQRDAAMSSSTRPKSGESWSVVSTPRGKAEMENLKKELGYARVGERDQQWTGLR